MVDLPQPINHVVDRILEALAKGAKGGDNAGVPMSEAVNPCDRAIWYSFRWASPPETPNGLRESRFGTARAWKDILLGDLESIGCEIERFDLKTLRPLTAELANGHLCGKIEGFARGIPEAPKALHVIECKSHNEKSYKALVKDGVAKAKPEHFAQCQLYMKATGIDRALYLAVNKNTDERHAERLHADTIFAATVEARILHIIELSEPPSRLHDDPTSKAAFVCSFCRHKSICHEKAFARSNCRTCLHSTPFVPEWRCEKRCIALDYRAQQEGCIHHRYIPALVPGAQVDVQDGDLVVYQLTNGDQWIDGERHSK